MKMGLAILLLSLCCAAQQAPNGNQPSPNPTPNNQVAQTVTIPAGTRTLLVLLSPLSTKNAQPGQGVYMQTAVPISADNRTVVPPGSYINGVIQTAKRPGRIKGRAELQIHFTSITFPSGYSEAFPATVGSAPANENAKVGSEGRIQENEQKGRDAGVLIGTTAAGAGLGGAADGGRGAGIGAGVGAAVGLATVLLTRGDEVRFAVGDPIEMVLDRPLTINHAESDSRGFEYVPRPARARNEDSDSRRTQPVGYPGPVYPPIIWTPNWPR